MLWIAQERGIYMVQGHNSLWYKLSFSFQNEYFVKFQIHKIECYVIIYR